MLLEKVAKWQLRKLVVARNKAAAKFEAIEVRYNYFLNISMLAIPSNADYQTKIGLLRQRSTGLSKSNELLSSYLRAKRKLENIDLKIDRLERLLDL